MARHDGHVSRIGPQSAETMRVLWFRGTGDEVPDIADAFEMDEDEVTDLLRRHGCDRPGGREAAEGLSARMLHGMSPGRWTVADPDVVAVALSRAETAGIDAGDMLHPDSDIESDRNVTVPLLLALSRVIGDGSEDDHWRAAGRLAHTPRHQRRRLITTRRLPDGGIMASMHPFELADGLILLDTLPDAWLLSSAIGVTLEAEGAPEDVANMRAMADVEIGRDLPAPIRAAA